MLKREYKLEDKTWNMLFKLGAPHEFEAGETIYLQDEPSSGLVCLERGSIKNCVFLPDGTEKTLCILESPNLTGETAIVDGGPSICSAIALTKTSVFFIPKEKAQEFLLSNPNLMMLMMSVMAKKLRCMKIQAEDMAANIPQRLSHMLFNFNKYGVFTHNEDEPRLIITHDELACFIGTSRPKITKYLNEFMKQGLIDKGRGYVTIKDYNGLNRIFQPNQ